MQVPTPITDQEARDLLSSDRLEGYHLTAAPSSDRELLGRYLQNVAISQNFYPYFHGLEVVLRNRLYAAVAKDHVIDSAALLLYNDFPCWLDATASILLPDHRKIVATAKADVIKDLRRRYGPTKSQAKRMYTPGRLVAKLSMSFWVFLFDSDYVGNGRGDPGVLWPRYFADVFPNRATPRGAADIGKIRQRLRRLLVVRNRLMHFERVAPWENYENTVLAPRQVLDDIVDLLDGMSTRAASVITGYGPQDYVLRPSFGRYLRRFASRP